MPWLARSAQVLFCTGDMAAPGLLTLINAINMVACNASRHFIDTGSVPVYVSPYLGFRKRLPVQFRV